MHNLSLTGLDNSSVMSNNITVIDAALDYVSHRKWVGASDLEDMAFGGTPTYHAGTATVHAPRWTLPNGIISGVGFYAPRNRDWLFGVLSLVVHYESSSTTGSISWGVCITPVADLTAISALEVAVSKASPTVANLMTTAEFNTKEIAATSETNRSHIGAIVSLSRDGGADTNNGDVQIYGIELVYNEKRRTVGDK